MLRLKDVRDTLTVSDSKGLRGECISDNSCSNTPRGKPRWSHYHVLALVAVDYHVSGVKWALRSISHTCTSLHSHWTLEDVSTASTYGPTSSIFHATGVKFVRPPLCRRGNLRKPTCLKLKAYACLVVCLNN